jgi:carboxyl-terminal processing protease
MSSTRLLRLAPVLLALFAVPVAAADEVLPLEPSIEQSRTTGRILSRLVRNHYVQQDIDDARSEALFDAYLGSLDPARLFLLAADVQEFERWRTALDDALFEGDLEPAYAIFNRLRERRLDRIDELLAGLEGRLEAQSFDGDDAILLDRSEAPWPQDETEAAALFEQRFKNEVLGLRLAGRDAEAIGDVLRRRYEDQRRRLAQVDGGDVFRVWMNVVTQSYDPHTEYFPPRDAENFDIRMSLSLEGIGALLGSEGEYCRVERIIPGGPADQDGRLKAADRIAGVAQGEQGEMIDVVGWRNDEIVELIRGPKDTVVRLSVLPAGQGDAAKPREIDITRDEVKLEEQSATAEVVEIAGDGGAKRIGVIDLPAFYIDFEAARAGDPDYKSATRDVAKLVEELSEDGVDGIVLDLRGNGGGSLIEAQELTGLFLGSGPVVQVRGANRRVEVAPAPPGRPLWNGPLGVLVDRISASASEIFAAAVQDTNRGVVMGSRTFGKGTVQGLAPFEDGQLKVTTAMFYRLSGSSTQHQGVVPDVTFPGVYDEEDIGESALDGALPWASIPPARYKLKKAHDIEAMSKALQSQHEARLNDEPELAAVAEQLALRQDLRGRETLSLNESEREADNEATDARLLAIENRRREALGEQPLVSLDDLENEERLADEVDPFAREAAQVVVDFIALRNALRDAARPVLR